MKAKTLKKLKQIADKKNEYFAMQDVKAKFYKKVTGKDKPTAMQALETLIGKLHTIKPVAEKNFIDKLFYPYGNRETFKMNTDIKNYNIKP